MMPANAQTLLERHLLPITLGMVSAPTLHMLDRAEEVDQPSGETGNRPPGLAAGQLQTQVSRLRASKLAGNHLDAHQDPAQMATRRDARVLAQTGTNANCVKGTPAVQVTTAKSQAMGRWLRRQTPARSREPAGR